MDLLFESWGSNSNMGALVLANRQMNQIKGKFFSLKDPFTDLNLEKKLLGAVQGNELMKMEGMSYILKVSSTSSSSRTYTGLTSIGDGCLQLSCNSSYECSVSLNRIQRLFGSVDHREAPAGGTLLLWQ